MKMLIVGSRSIKDFDLTPYVHDDIDMIITGGAVGIDSVAEIYADKMRISKLIMRPKYKLYGKAAPVKRNYEMVQEADCILVIWDGKSKGTKHTIDYAEKSGKKTEVIMVGDSCSDVNG